MEDSTNKVRTNRSLSFIAWAGYLTPEGERGGRLGDGAGLGRILSIQLSSTMVPFQILCGVLPGTPFRSQASRQPAKPSQAAPLALVLGQVTADELAVLGQPSHVSAGKKKNMHNVLSGLTTERR